MKKENEKNLKKAFIVSAAVFLAVIVPIAISKNEKGIFEKEEYKGKTEVTLVSEYVLCLDNKLKPTLY